MIKKPHRQIHLAAAALAVAAMAAPGFAGEPDKKCSASAETCVRMMSEKLAKKGWIGIEMNEKDEKGRPVITRVVSGSPAVEAGFRVGDVLTAINGVSDEDGEEAAYAEWKRSMVPANKVVVTVQRGGDEVDLNVTLGTIPDAVIAQWIGYHMLEQHMAQADADDGESSDETAESP